MPSIVRIFQEEHMEVLMFAGDVYIIMTCTMEALGTEGSVLISEAS